MPQIQLELEILPIGTTGFVSSVYGKAQATLSKMAVQENPYVHTEVHTALWITQTAKLHFTYVVLPCLYLQVTLVHTPLRLSHEMWVYKGHRDTAHFYAYIIATCTPSTQYLTTD